MEGLKLQTPVETGRSKVGVSLNDKIVILGSCFADNMGQKMVDLGFDVCLNPFGTLYNPVSVCNSVARLTSGIPFSKDECVQMGAGAGLVCSFSHHTSFARRTEDEFLQVANASLKEASLRWKAASKVIITLGTAWIYEYLRSGETVSNCLKIDAKEFSRRRLSVRETATLLMNMIARHPEKEFMFTVSPIRHFKDGAHGNQISKSTLLLALDEVLAKFPERCEYFPAYEIVLDELRDYRFYAADMIHPSDQAVDYLWSRFVRFAMPESELPALDARRRELLRAQHRPIHG
ncbi:gSCFA family protein [Alistipes sp. CAG:435]|nr:GSCFA domain-containing protein [Alistipes sp.]MDY4725579.1 GSCFA domain-containing protein [Candidatus Cryptobacteroides sp.]MDY5199387.1 GSCFA domain-containing protein [Candidatus Cryptobacteroides sp.]CDD16000.1 gSCFA family protein [Alistipes sp. CAG:435]